MQDWIRGFLGKFLFKFENQEIFSLILQTENPLETFLSQKNFLRK